MAVAPLKAFCASIASDEDLRGQVHAAAHRHAVDKTVLLREHARAITAAPDHALIGIKGFHPTT